MELNLDHLIRPAAFQTRISRAVRRKTLALVKELPGPLLDVGAGNGIFILELNVLNNSTQPIYGLDYDIDILREGRQLRLDNDREPDIFIGGDATQLPFRDNLFRACFCLNTFMNIESQEIINGFIREMYRICQPGGLVIFEFRNALNIPLRIKYYLNYMTKKLLPRGYYRHQFHPLLRRLNPKKVSFLPIGAKFPLFSLSFLGIIEK